MSGQDRQAELPRSLHPRDTPLEQTAQAAVRHWWAGWQCRGNRRLLQEWVWLEILKMVFGCRLMRNGVGASGGHA